ncbi:SUKH-4 family immunity protein [Photobacterium halotolerans]|uniref:SUKH-4 family immunity protein n=1 Tax=Photobacterium halotolerans TaxID=265726 RepID=UPI00048A0602|nr:SUKH-4 family immunity protein [Photobacterium halotolerans]
MKLSEFKKRYIAALPEVPKYLDLKLDNFHLYDSSLPGTTLLKRSDLEHLVTVGMPSQASPFLSFGSYSDWEYNADRYFPIAADGSGSNLCIDSGNGEVVLLDHDWGMKRVFINSSLEAFSECLCIYQECLRDQSINNCMGLMYSAGSELYISGEWWANEVSHS